MQVHDMHMRCGHARPALKRLSRYNPLNRKGVLATSVNVGPKLHRHARHMQTTSKFQLFSACRRNFFYSHGLATPGLAPPNSVPNSADIHGVLVSIEISNNGVSGGVSRNQADSTVS